MNWLVISLVLLILMVNSIGRSSEGFSSKGETIKLKMNLGKSLTITGDIKDGSRAWLTDFADSSRQKWSYDQESGLIWLTEHPGKYLSSEDVAKNGAKLWLWDKIGANGSVWQRWTINADGTISLRDLSAMTISIAEGADKLPTGECWMWHRVGPNGNRNQQWTTNLLPMTGLVGQVHSLSAGHRFGELLAEVLSPRINYSWGKGNVLGQRSNNVAIRWTGYLKANVKGDHYFAVRTDDGSRLWVNNILIVDSWKIQNLTRQEGKESVYLDPSEMVSLKYEWFQARGDATSILLWKQPGRDWEPLSFKNVYREVPVGTFINPKCHHAWQSQKVDFTQLTRMANGGPMPEWLHNRLMTCDSCGQWCQYDSERTAYEFSPSKGGWTYDHSGTGKCFTKFGGLIGPQLDKCHSTDCFQVPADLNNWFDGAQSMDQLLAMWKALNPDQKQKLWKGVSWDGFLHGNWRRLGGHTSNIPTRTMLLFTDELHSPGQCYNFHPQVLKSEIGGMASHPALNADQILRVYRKNGKTPVNGAYWIRAWGSGAPHEVYCNFLKKQGGFMLIGSVNKIGKWLNLRGQGLFNPRSSVGKYWSDGRSDNYLRPWVDLDPNTLMDNNVSGCVKMGFKYNEKYRYCQSGDGKRLRVPGGRSLLLLMTGNGKYWVILNLSDLENPSGKNLQKIVRVVKSSDNFKGSCEPNKWVCWTCKDGVNTLNMGNSPFCGDDQTMWSDAGDSQHTSFMVRNGGIKAYVGGSYQDQKPKVIPHHVSHHRAPHKGRMQSTYEDAKMVCESLGKKVCSREELTEAQQAGYSSCACGWTSDRDSSGRHWVGYPTGLSTWSALNTNRDDADNHQCGVIGMNQCGWYSPDKMADIYCCDKFTFSENFEKLDHSHFQATSWITALEQEFLKTYGTQIPSPIELRVYGESGSSVIVSKHGNRYELINSDEGHAPRKLPSLRCQFGRDSRFKDLSETAAIFMISAPSHQIATGKFWPRDTGKLSPIRYGAVIRIANDGNYLRGTSIKFWHKNSSKRSQVNAGDTVSNETLWIVKAPRRSGKLDAYGYGDEKALYGTPVMNGNVFRLQSVATGRNLHSNVQFVSPVGGQEVYQYGLGKEGDANDHWTLQLDRGDVWFTNTGFRIVHTNTNKVLTVSTHQYRPDPKRSISSMAVNAIHERSRGNLWTVAKYQNPDRTRNVCDDLSNEIVKRQHMMDMGRKMGVSMDYGELERNIDSLKRKYNTRCQRVSKYYYDKHIGDVNDSVVSVNRKYTGLKKTLHDLQGNEKLLSTNVANKNETIERKQRELIKLKNKRCPPSTQCLPDVNPPPIQISDKCAPVVPLLKKGQVNDQVKQKITQVIRGKDNINNYDIRTHRDYKNLVAVKDVTSCEK